MRSLICFFAPLVICLAFYTSCTKPGTETPPNVDTLPALTDTTKFSVTNKWQCVVDGNTYSGSIDTSFLQMVFPPYLVDSVIVCTGTSADKKTRIHFKLALDRSKYPVVGVNNSSSSTNLVFLPSANNLSLANETSVATNIVYQVDTAIGNNLVVSYSGTITDRQLVSHSIKGTLSCKLNTGTNEPNKFYCLLDSAKRFGYFKSTLMNANTLIMEGIDYMDYPLYQLRLAVRTGGTIKPGIYNSSNGDVNFVSVPPGPVNNRYFVDDTRGHMTVIVESVNGNIVKGSFSGVNEALDTIRSGTFICRVENYIPETDSRDRWAFSTLNSAWNNVYNCFAGNITSAVKTNSDGRYLLTINGETDNQASKFKIVVSSREPIKRGLFQMHNYPSERIDSIYFKSGSPTWDQNFIHLYADASTLSFGGETQVYIDTIDDNHVVGTFQGDIWGSELANRIHRASFNAGF